MNLYLISQNANEETYDVFDSAVVAAEDKEKAKLIHPGGSGYDPPTNQGNRGTWAHLDEIEVEFIGVGADRLKPGVIVSSFNAG